MHKAHVVGAVPVPSEKTTLCPCVRVPTAAVIVWAVATILVTAMAVMAPTEGTLKVHILVAHDESVLIPKVLRPMVGHAKTPAPSDTDFSEAQFVIEVQPPHEGEGPEASENWTRCLSRSVPTGADTVLTVADKDVTAPSDDIAVTAVPKHVDGP